MATRPTSDRVREAIFNILGPPPEGARVLDLYAGAGGLGLEALSRGAAWAVFVDAAPEAVRCVEQNARDLGFAEQVRVVRAPVATALGRLAQEAAAHAWIFADPPYAGDEAERTLGLLGAGDAPLLAAAGTVIVEHDRRRPPADQHGALALTDRRRYGDTEVSFYRRGR